jgi:hypothetical protein
MSRDEEESLESRIARAVAEALANVGLEQRRGPAQPAEPQAREGGDEYQGERQRQGERRREPSWDRAEARAYEERRDTRARELQIRRSRDEGRSRRLSRECPPDCGVCDRRRRDSGPRPGPGAVGPTRRNSAPLPDTAGSQGSSRPLDNVAGPSGGSVRAAEGVARIQVPRYAELRRDEENHVSAEVGVIPPSAE